MKFIILDKKEENGSVCYLIKSTLEKYIYILPSDYDSYEVQRSIVSNSYLDRLVDTVLKKAHIPSITLVSDKVNISDDNLIMEDFKILDGLQRTHRLKLISDTKDLFLNQICNQIEEISDFQIKRKYRDELNKINSTGNILIAIKDYYNLYGKDKLCKCFTENTQWFEVWVGLSPNEEVRKMLVLNAGHKQVNIKHQLELLFQNILPVIEEVKSGDIHIIREKHSTSQKYSKERVLGDYHFSHLISSLVSFVEGKPISTNTKFIEKIQNDDKKLEEFLKFFTYEFLELFIRSIYIIDCAAQNVFEDKGIQWIGREVSLVSMFAAIGEFSKKFEDIEIISRRLADNFSKTHLLEYEGCRNNVDLAKVNIGNVNRRYIFEAFTYFIESDFSMDIDWRLLFEGGDK